MAETIAHELAHHWFGNWVTMRWWDDLWLNEAFATWIAFKAVDDWKPSWRMWLDFERAKGAALDLDSLRSTHPVRAEVGGADEAVDAFDAITYRKGGAVLRMVEAFVGEESFREGIRLYMRRHGRGNAAAGDLWAALAEASGQPISELATAWIDRSGYPLIAISEQDGRVALVQTRYVAELAAAESGAWPVPIVLRFEDDAGVHRRRFLLRQAIEHSHLEARGRVRWLCANDGATGFYRVGYESRLLEALAEHSRSLLPVERIALVSDTWALVRCGRLTIGAFLDLAVKFADEDDHAVVEEVIDRLWNVERRFVDDGDRGRFRARIVELYGYRFDQVGWDADPREQPAHHLYRAALLRAVGVVGRSGDVRAQAQDRLDRFLAGDRRAVGPDLHESITFIAARSGDRARFEELRRMARDEPDPVLRRRYLLGLACFEEPELAARAVGLALDGEVPAAEQVAFWSALLANERARDPAWQSIQEGWRAMSARIENPMILRRIVEAITLLPPGRHVDAAKRFLEAPQFETAGRAVAQTLERMHRDAAVAERISNEVGPWLASKAGAGP